MLTKGDDYPIHQRSEPIAYSGTDRNFYDRYFFNGYRRDGAHFFAVAMGIYPHLNVLDASFCVIHNGIQHNVHASRILGMERMDTFVGPIRVEVVEPLSVLRVLVDDADHGIKAELTFHRRAAAIEEPRFIHRNGPRTAMDYTRLTQNGDWEGWIEISGTRIEVTREEFQGTRDRSWGVRNIGTPDPQPLAPEQEPQFYWLWAPLNFDDRISLYHKNADVAGEAWNTAGVIAPVPDGAPTEYTDVHSEVAYMSGTRHAKSAVIRMRGKGGETSIELTRKFEFFMSGLGYLHPEWGHGTYHGELEVGYETFDLSDMNVLQPNFVHVQAFCDARMTLPDGATRDGVGVLEQLVLGRYEPHGFKELLDPAP